MTYSKQMHWRAIVLRYVYAIATKDISLLLGMKERSIIRWNQQFKTLGHISPHERNKRSSRWDQHVIDFVNQYSLDHPCIYIEEIQVAIKDKFPLLTSTSASTICRALRFDLNLTRKVLEKRARESSDAEIRMYHNRLQPFYSNQTQLVFVDKTSKDGRDALRKFAWSRRNTPAIVSLPFGRGQRVSVLAAMDCNGFFGWDFTEGTFDRNKFYAIMCQKIIPYLNPWPLPRSILILDNAKIHMYSELEQAVHSRGALLFFLPPYSPHLNPIEVAFAQLKKWILRYPLAFRTDIRRTLDVALVQCIHSQQKTTDTVKIGGTNLYDNCGYEIDALNQTMFEF